MESKKTTTEKQALRIGIIGAGFSGTAIAANLHRYANQACEIFLFEKSGLFGAGDAYRTPYSFHLLNVRAKDMSAFEEESTHFVEWIKADEARQVDLAQPLEDQFASRKLYGSYLQDLIKSMQSQASSSLTLKATEIIDAKPIDSHIQLTTLENEKIIVDKVILALGNNPPSSFPVPISTDIKCIANPWDYTALTNINKNDPVLIVGTGLSMIDAVLTLHHQQHAGPIYALSRHGLLPLPHAHTQETVNLSAHEFSADLTALTKQMRAKIKSHTETGGDWRTIINAFRNFVPAVWGKANLKDKKQFLRHMVAYWNVHRHRVTEKVINCLTDLVKKDQLIIMSGRLTKVTGEIAEIKLRHQPSIKKVEIKWLINCMGPATTIKVNNHALLQSLIQHNIAAFDELQLGLDTTQHGELKNKHGKVSRQFYALGPLRRGQLWETSAVPEIRKQCFDLARHLLEIN